MTEKTVVPSLEETVARMKREVLQHVASGRVPASVKSFSELHDYVDANEYGGFCEDELSDVLIRHFGGRDEHEGMPQGMLDYISAARTAVHEWLSGGDWLTCRLNRVEALDWQGMTKLVAHMRLCGWEETPGSDGGQMVVHEALGLAFPSWMQAIMACIEVASEA